jgi:hypothetical protein
MSRGRVSEGQRHDERAEAQQDAVLVARLVHRGAVDEHALDELKRDREEERHAEPEPHRLAGGQPLLGDHDRAARDADEQEHVRGQQADGGHGAAEADLLLDREGHDQREHDDHRQVRHRQSDGEQRERGQTEEPEGHRRRHADEHADEQRDEDRERDGEGLALCDVGDHGQRMPGGFDASSRSPVAVKAGPPPGRGSVDERRRPRTSAPSRSRCSLCSSRRAASSGNRSRRVRLACR